MWHTMEVEVFESEVQNIEWPYEEGGKALTFEFYPTEMGGVDDLRFENETQEEVIRDQKDVHALVEEWCEEQQTRPGDSYGPKRRSGQSAPSPPSVGGDIDYPY